MRSSDENGKITGRFASKVLPGLAGTVLGVTLILAGIAQGYAAGPLVQSVVIKFRDAVVAADAQRLPAETTAMIEGALGTPVSELERTRDGAFVLRLGQSLSLDDARAAINRARNLGDVLYASIAPSALPDPLTIMAKLARTQPPVTRLMVKFRDSALTRASAQNQSLAAPQLDRLSQLAGQPIAHERAMGGGAYVVRLMQALPADQAYSLAKYLETDPSVEFADPDLRMFPTLVPNDPQYANQWHYMSPPGEIGGANLPPAWDLTTGSTNIVVAVIDTGILPHPDLVGRTLPGYDMIADCALANDAQPGPCTWSGSPSYAPNFTSRDANAADPGDWVTANESTGFGTSAPPYNWFLNCGASNSSWHGTHVAGTIGAVTNNGTGVAGINWVSKIVPVRVLGKCGGYTSDIVDGMTWASGLSVPGAPANPNPARVLNLSLGGSGACGSGQQNAINAMIAAGTTVVIAAGNDNDNYALYNPGNCNGVITVAATQRQGFKAHYSNYGAGVEIAAPGGGKDFPSGTYYRVLSTLNSGTTTPVANDPFYTGYAGTSMATPHVVGIASLLLSRNPSLTPAQVLSKIQTTARVFPISAGNTCDTGTTRPPSANWVSCTCTTAICGAGIIDAGAAVAATAPPGGVGHDFNNDGKGDLFWRHQYDLNYIWQMNGSMAALLALPSVIGPDWVAGGFGDIDKDGNSDIVWHHTPSGGVYTWLLNAAGVKAGGVHYVGIVGPSWNIEAVGDFNGDGVADILWRHSSGAVYVWYLTAGSAIGSVVPLGSIASTWRVAGIGDFDGNGTQDIVWSHDASGTAYAWTTNPGGGVLSVVLLGASPGSVVAKVADFDGDGKADLFWRNPTTGSNAIWYMNGTALSQAQALSPVAVVGWKLAATGDFDADGKSDVLWYYAPTGLTYQWLMKGRAALPSVIGLGSVGTNWFLPGQ
ncbi:MAG: S8 family serine peptidase [Betaproteobacteria bacterium]